MPTVECKTTLEHNPSNPYRKLYTQCNSPYSGRLHWLKDGLIPYEERVSTSITYSTITCPYVISVERGIAHCINNKTHNIALLGGKIDRFIGIVTSDSTKPGFIKTESNCVFYEAPLGK